jgi:hypothetical protein
MGTLTCEINKSDESIVIKLSGEIDEDSFFPEVDYSGAKNIEFNFEGLNNINSCGIRDWVGWLKKIPTELNSSFINCPPFIIDQVNMINGFVPEGGTINSFQVPYYCDDTDEVIQKLYVRGVDYTGDDCTIEKIYTCPECDAGAEIDVIEQKYFKFLKNFG